MIAAAGSGRRLGAGGPKALVELAGRPMLEWSLLALAAAETIERVVVAAPPGHESEVAAPAGIDLVVVTGGATRAESVAAALTPVEGEIVAVHDAARPLASAGLFDGLVRRLVGSDADGVIAAAPVADTLKLAGAGEIVARTVDRAGLWAAQTPQVFGVDALRSAQELAREDGELEAATDEAWLVERAGGTVLLESGGAPNPKVTDAGDLRAAEALLSARSVHGPGPD